MVSKVDYKYSSPTDYLLYWIASKISPILHNLGFIPNDITNLSVLFFLVSMYFLYHNNIYLGIVFFSLNFFFDCLDGYMARKYNQVSVFGDWYDHITDFISIISITMIIICKLKSDYKYLLIFIGVILMYLLLKYIGCQQTLLSYNNTYKSNSLSFTTKLCKYEPHIIKNKLIYLRFFGHGQVLLYGLFLLYLSYKST